MLLPAKLQSNSQKDTYQMTDGQKWANQIHVNDDDDDDDDGDESIHK